MAVTAKGGVAARKAHRTSTGTGGGSTRAGGGSGTQKGMTATAAAASTTSPAAVTDASMASSTPSSAAKATTTTPLQSRRGSSQSLAVASQAILASGGGNTIIDPSIIAALPEVPFPKKGITLDPADLKDDLLMLCARACASVDNRALTPKEIAMICAHKWGWSCSGSQPFALISSCIRSHLRRAAIAGYPPMFATYELASVPPPEDVPCLGIQADAKPLVKRGTFWFLAESVGFPNPFPHRLAAASSEHDPALSQSLPGTPSLTTKGRGATGIRLSFQSQSSTQADEKPVTRAQANAKPILGSSEKLGSPEAQMSRSLDQTAKDTLGRGKRKRTASAAVNKPLDGAGSATPLRPSLNPSASAPQTIPPSTASAPFYTPLLPISNLIADSPLQPLSVATPTPAAPADRKTRQGQRRTQSSSASDPNTRPLPALRKLKLRLSSLSEHGPAPLPNRPESPQPHPKRPRTQSMSSFAHQPSGFPFDSLPYQLHGHPAPPVPGTMYPLELHNIHHAHFSHHLQQHAMNTPLDLLTSRSAPESNIFSPGCSAAGSNVCGPFSRRGSPSALRSLPRESSLLSDLDSEGGSPEMDLEYDGWAGNSYAGSTTPSALPEPSLSDYHESMLQSDLDFELDFSLDGIDTPLNDALGSNDADAAASDSGLNLRSLSDDVDGIFEGLRATSIESESIAVPKSEDEQDGEEIRAAKMSPQTDAALDATLCPAANKYGDSVGPSRLLARRMDSSSSFIFPRLNAHGSPITRPASLSRQSSRDVLTTPVPLSDLPSLQPPTAQHPILLYEDEDHVSEEGPKQESEDLESPLTPVVKAEEDADDMALDERRSLSRSCSTLSDESADSFNPDTIYAHEPSASRSHSSSRGTSMSVRDSFSPQAPGPNADWALTPPSEEEHLEDEEKSFDRATLLGPESVGIDDLDDEEAWGGRHGEYTPTENMKDSGVFIHDMEIFEPVLSPAPIAVCDLPANFTSRPLSPIMVLKAEPSTSFRADTELDENAAAALFIADSSANEDLQSGSADMEMDEDRSRQEMSPVTAASNAAASSLDAQLTLTPSEATATMTSIPAQTQSFLFYPERPLSRDVTILLTDTKILFYSTLVDISESPRPLLRRVDNDAVDAEALLSSLAGTRPAQDKDREDSLAKIKELGNTWVSLDFARELLKKFGGEKHELEGFLADDILLQWNEKLVKLGTMLRQKNGLATPVSPSTPVPISTQTGKGGSNAKRTTTATPPIQPQAIQPKSAAPAVRSPATKVAKAATPVKPTAAAATTPVSVAKKGRASSATSSSRRSTRNKA